MKLIEIVAISALASSVSAAVVPVLNKQQKMYSFLTRATKRYSGDMTYYDPTVGLGSCGKQGTNSERIVALAADVMANGPNPNNNPKCGKTINIYYQGKTRTGTVFDTCPECVGGSIDVTQVLFEEVAPDGDGRVHGVSWSFA